jgi:AcrR family transcriptional regulator
MARQASRSRGPHQLPAGRHGLTRDYVVQNQQERLLTAVAEVAGVGTYATMTVEDIIGAAGVSRRTFYDHFRSKDDAFLAAYDVYAEDLATLVEEAVADAGDDFVDRAAALVETMVDFFAADAGAAHVCISEVLAAGTPAIERRAATLRRLVAALQDAASALPRRGRPSGLVHELAIEGIYGVLLTRVAAGRLEELPDLAPDLVAAVVLPYVGAEDASAARRVVKARRRRRAA